MRDAIVEKLRAFLAEPVDSECKVVYLLCQIRKILEENPPDPDVNALWLHCHWALHTELTYPRTTLRLLKRADEFAAIVLKGREEFEIAQVMQILYEEFLFLRTFQAQLQAFLEFFQLPTAICDEFNLWSTFLKHYTGVIEDGPLSCEGSKYQQLQYISRVVITKKRSQGMEGSSPFDIKWDMQLKDGQVLGIQVSAQEVKRRNMNLRLVITSSNG